MKVYLLIRQTEYKSESHEVIGVYSRKAVAKKVAVKMAKEDVQADQFKPQKEVTTWTECDTLEFSWDDVSYRYQIDEHQVLHDEQQ